MKKAAFLFFSTFILLASVHAQAWRKPVGGKFDDCNHNMMVWCAQTVPMKYANSGQVKSNALFFEILQNLSSKTGNAIPEGSIPTFDPSLEEEAVKQGNPGEIPPVVELWRCQNRELNTRLRSYMNQENPGNVLFEFEHPNGKGNVTVQLGSKREVDPGEPTEYELTFILMIDDGSGNPYAWPFFIRAAGSLMMFATRAK